MLRIPLIHLLLVNITARGQAPWSTILVVGVLLLAVALSIGILLHYRQRRLLGLQAKEVLRVREENTKLKALLDGRVNEQQLISLEIQNEIGSGLASLLAIISTDPTPITTKPASIIPKPASTIADPTTVTADPTTVTTIPITIFKMQQTAEQLIRKTNEIAWMLDHEENSLGNLIINIRRNATHLLEQAGIDLHFTVDDEVPAMAVTQEFRRDVYLIVKEAVQNTVRHSGASVVEISIHIDAGGMTIVVRDNGKGIYKAGGSHWGNGMKDMQRRVEQIDGRMEITAGAGTAITIVSPLPYL